MDGEKLFLWTGIEHVKCVGLYVDGNKSTLAYQRVESYVGNKIYNEKSQNKKALLDL